jgi:hypothetical protein
VASDLTNFLTQSVERAQPRAAPFYHIEFNRVFPDDIYAAMLREMPDHRDYRALRGRHGENLLDDGSPTRVKIDLFPEYIHRLPRRKRELWDEVGRALCSQEVKAAFMRRLGPGLERRFGGNYSAVSMFPIPVLTRDLPKYRITPHTDTHWKGITVQFYLPPDDTTKHIGTIFNERLPNGSVSNVIKMPFSPNSGYAFAVDDNTWHSADPVGPEVISRDSILLTYFVDSGLLRILRNRGKRIGNFVRNEVKSLLRLD